MLLLIPPKRKAGYAGDDVQPEPPRRVVVRSLAAVATVAATAWACSFGWAAAIVALLTAKHVLVAILLMDLGVDRPE